MYMRARSPPLALSLDAVNWRGNCDLYDNPGARKCRRQVLQQ